MLIELNRADRSRMHSALLEALAVGHEPPASPSEAAKAAFVEAVAMHADNPEVSLDDILDAADAVLAEVESRTGGRETPIEFDIPSLSAATGFKTYIAELVARLCGAMRFDTASGIKWKNTNAVVGPFIFPSDMMDCV